MNDSIDARSRRDSHVLGSCSLPAENLCTSGREANDFFASLPIFELGGIRKHLMTGSQGDSEFSYLPRGTGEVCGPLPKPLALFMT